MSMGDIVPVVPMGNGGGYGNGGWGDAVGAFAGALFGTWFGNGWNGGYGRGGSGGGDPTVVVTGGGNGGCCGGGSNAVLDALSGIQSGVNSLGLQTLQGQNSANLAMCQGFSGVVSADNANTASLMNAVTQGFAGLNAAEQASLAGVQQSLCQGFSGVNTAIMGASKDAALQSCQSTGAITTAISDCCCTTKQTIMAEGAATRELINKLAYENLQEKLCDSKAENAALKSQNFIASSQAAQNSQFQQMLNNQSAQFGALLAAYRTGRVDARSDTTTGGGTTA